MSEGDLQEIPQRGSPAFPDTRWSVVLRTGGDEAEAGAALQTLCQAYWYPLHAYLRRCGGDLEEARDLTQGFFLHAMDADLIQRARREKGRFRSYLLTSLQHFLATERRREQRHGCGDIRADREVRVNVTDEFNERDFSGVLVAVVFHGCAAPEWDQRAMKEVMSGADSTRPI